MIDHGKAQTLISARYDELLSSAETRALQDHLAACPLCRQFAAETDLLVTGLRSLPQLPPSPRVSRMVRDGIERGSSPWGWLGQGLRIATSPALAVASSLVLVAALAFIIVLAVRPLGLDEEPRATISALADVIETPTSEPEWTPLAAPTMAPTEAVVEVPTQEPTAAPTSTATTRVTNVSPPTQTPAPTADVEPTAVPTQRSILTRQQVTEAPAVETPPPTTVAPASTQPPAPTTAPPVATESPAPPIEQSSAGAPFSSEQELAAEAGDQPPALSQPTIAPSGADAGMALAPETSSEAATGPALEAAAAEPTEAPAPDTVNDTARQSAESATAPTAPPVAPTSTPVEIVAATSGPPAASGPAAPAEAPRLEERTGNEAISMDGDSMVAEIQATVQAGLIDDSGPPPVPTSSAPPQTPNPAADTAIMAPVGAEITGAPASGPLITEAAPAGIDAGAGPVTEGAAADAAGSVELAPAPTAIGEPVDPAPVVPQVVGAPEPGWPGISGGGTQLLSNAGYSAITDGGGVSVYAPDGTPLGWAGSGVPIWSPAGTSLLVIGPDGLGAVWDASSGLIPVERPSAGARDIPVGWYDGSPLVQRVYFDGSGLVELRVVPVTGAAGYVIGTATADSLFGEGVTAARLSPDGGQVAFVSGGQLYIAPVSDPASATPAS